MSDTMERWMNKLKMATYCYKENALVNKGECKCFFSEDYVCDEYKRAEKIKKEYNELLQHGTIEFDNGSVINIYKPSDNVARGKGFMYFIDKEEE